MSSRQVTGLTAECYTSLSHFALPTGDIHTHPGIQTCKRAKCLKPSQVSSLTYATNQNSFVHSFNHSVGVNFLFKSIDLIQKVLAYLLFILVIASNRLKNLFFFFTINDLHLNFEEYKF